MTIPFALVHIDTGLECLEVIENRDNWVNRLGARLVIASTDGATDVTVGAGMINSDS